MSETKCKKCDRKIRMGTDGKWRHISLTYYCVNPEPAEPVAAPQAPPVCEDCLDARCDKTAPGPCDCSCHKTAAQIVSDARDERIAELEAALTRLRDCDWVITLPDRMDAVRDIARGALEGKRA